MSPEKKVLIADDSPVVLNALDTLGESTKGVRIANSALVLAEDVQPLFSLRVSVIAAF